MYTATRRANSHKTSGMAAILRRVGNLKTDAP
jgi:hypothetical protein